MTSDRLFADWCGSVPVNCGALLLVIAACVGLGWGFTAACGGEKERRNTVSGARIAVECVVGMNLLGLIALLFNPGIILTPRWLLTGLLLLPAAAGGWRAVALLRTVGGAEWRFWRWPLLLLAAWQLYTLSSAWIAPYGWDEQTYQLAVPARWLRDGMAAVYPDNPYSGFPLFPQFVLLPGLKLGGLFAGRLFCWFGYGLFSVICTLALERRVGRFAACVLVGTFMISSAMLSLQRHVYAELFILLNLAAAILYGQRAGKNSSPAIWGVLAGGAAAVKLTGVIVAALIGMIFVTGEHRCRIRRIFIAAAAAALFGGLFYLRPWLATGNPCYPFLASVFTPGDSAALAVDAYHRALGNIRYGISGVSALASSWVLAAFSEGIFDGIVLGLPYLLLTVTALAGTVYYFRRGRRPLYEARWMLLAAGFYAAWFYSAPQTRFLLPGALLILFAAAEVMRKLNRRARTALLIAVALLGGYINIYVFRHFEVCWTALWRGTPPVKTLPWGSRDPAYFAMLDYLACKLPESAKVLILGDIRGLYMVRDFRIVTPGFQGKYLTGEPSERAFAELAESERANYLLAGAPPVNPDFLPEHGALLSRHMDALVPGVAAKRFRVIYAAGPYILIELRGSGLEKSPKKI